MPRALSAEQVERYERDGVLAPLQALSRWEAGVLRSTVEELEERLGGRPPASLLGECHLHFRWAYELVTRPAILDAVEDLLGPNIIVHSTTIFCKYPQDPGYISWHQDGYYWGLDAPRVASACFALTDSTKENGCLRVVRGSHKQDRVLHSTSAISEDNILSSGLEVAIPVDEGLVMEVLLCEGEISFHHVYVIHGSRPNRTDTKRIVFAVRYAAAEVQQTTDHWPVVLARGRDLGHFKLLESAPSADVAEGVAAQVEFCRWLVEFRRAQGRDESSRRAPRPSD